MNIKRDKTVLRLRETSREQKGMLAGQYPHVVGDKFYYEMVDPQEVHYAVWDGEKYKKPLYNNIVKKSLSAHNFRAFIDTNPNCPEDERYKAVGGYHVGRSSIKTPVHIGLHQAKLYQELLDCPISKDLEVLPLQDPVWPDYTKLLFKDDCNHPRHANGLYVFVSPDGINWKEYNETPIFSCFTETEDFDNVLSFDTMPSIFYDDNINEYVIYLRANLSLGIRHAMYSHSKDLINWSKPKFVVLDPPFDMSHTNIYYMGAYRYPNSKKYIAFPAHFKNDIIHTTTSMSKLYDETDGQWMFGDAEQFIGGMENEIQRRYYDAKTLIMVSDDGVNWKTIDEIFISETAGHMTFPHVVSFREEGDEYALYVNEDFMTIKTSVARYTIDKKELDDAVG